MVSVFWLLIGLCFYGYIGYPLLLAILHQIIPKGNEEARSANTGQALSVSILIAAFNEEVNIEEKLVSLVAQDYPAESFTIWVLNDGSTDTTAQIVQSFLDERVRLLDLPRSGKATVLNRGVAASRGDIIVFSDADTVWQPSTLRKLVTPFQQQSIGAVAGNLRTHRQLNHLGHGDKIYHCYESAIRSWETQLGSAVSADGGLFAVRRMHWEELPQDVTDDFFISTGAVVGGQRIVFAPEAIAFDKGVEKAASQLNKRVRITVQGLTSLWRRRCLFNPFRFGVYSFFLFSHKLVRRLVPAFGLLLLPVNTGLLEEGAFYRVTFYCQLLVYLVAFVGLLSRGTRLPKVFALVGYVMLNSYGVLSGLAQFLCGKRFTSWSPEQSR